MTVSRWQEVADPLQAEHDDVVIGAGIVGSYAATILGQRDRDVALVDAHFPAAGASGRKVTIEPLRSSKVYISFCTMSVVSPIERLKSSVRSIAGIRIRR